MTLWPRRCTIGFQYAAIVCDDKFLQPIGATIKLTRRIFLYSGMSATNEKRSISFIIAPYCDQISFLTICIDDLI